MGRREVIPAPGDSLGGLTDSGEGPAGIGWRAVGFGSETMARIVGHLPVEELEARYRTARDVTEARHFQAI